MPYRLTLAACLLSAASWAGAQAAMQTISGGNLRFEIDTTEVSIGQFQAFVRATGTVTAAERAGGGSTFENGWEQRRGWTWRAPFGSPGAASEPAVHITHAEAGAYCRWAGKRLPSDAEWAEAAYTERRANPPAGFASGKTYPYPTGDSPQGANCLGDCGPVSAVANAISTRGRGHAEVGTTRAGVNGLFDMGGNAWEWVDGASTGVDGTNSASANAEQRTRGGSWWYGAAQMRRDHLQSKPANTAVVYIGFRCAKSL